MMATKKLHHHRHRSCDCWHRSSQGCQIVNRAVEAGELAPARHHEQDHQQYPRQQDDDVALVVEQGIAHGGLPLLLGNFTLAVAGRICGQPSIKRA